MAKIDVKQRSIFNDLVRKFQSEGHRIFVVCPIERREGKKTYIKKYNGVSILYVRTLNVQKTNVFEKGIGQISIAFLFKNAIRKFYKGVNCDLILYTTPPVFLFEVVAYMKRKNPNALTYLMLKDMFPQNALDLGMMKTTGLSGYLYRNFKKKEAHLYKVSDYIGCTSPAHITYLLQHNSFIPKEKVSICPNSIELVETRTYQEIKDNGKDILIKYGIPTDKPIIIYGGNLGIPQDIPFVIKCLEENKTRDDCYFVVVGSGTSYPMIKEWYQKNKDFNVTVLKGLPKDDYDLLVQSCHIGLIFLDYRFTFPNYPSRILSYLEYKMPIICVTDRVCDMGYIAEENGFGYYVPSNSVCAFSKTVEKMLSSDIQSMGERGYEFLKNNYLVEHSYQAIMDHLK